jgi:uncharacterized protein YkwD
VFGRNFSERSGVLSLIALGASKPEQTLELRARRVTIGSAADNDLRLDEPTVSRRHAALEWRWGRWRVVDFGSTNGTYVNGRRVNASSPAPLRRGDQLRFGNARFGLVAPGDDPARIGAGAARRAAARPRRLSRRAIAAGAMLLFAGGFGVTEYLLNFSRLEEARVAEQSSATPAAGRAASGPAPASPSASTPAARASAAAAALARATPERVAPAGGGDIHVAAATGAARAAADGAGLQWLARINYYRAMVKLPPVSDDPALSEGERNHTRYLVENYGALIRNGVSSGAAMHSEDSAKPGYTPIGLRAAQDSDIDEWPGPQPPPSLNWAIDDWMTGAFHRLNVLNPRLHQVAYGQWCDGGTCAAALNVLSGAEEPAFAGLPLAAPLMFPPQGSTVALGPLWGEWPDPASACPGYRAPVGLPITMQLGLRVNARLGEYRLTRAGESPVDLDACGFDAATYANSDPVAQERGRGVLHDFGAVALIPRAPLEKRTSYTVSMTVNGRKYTWAFSTAP